MMGISIVGIAFGLTNLYSIYTDAPSKIACQVEHVKAAVGAGFLCTPHSWCSVSYN